jgi:uncharacterized protein YprB with RNaseH-like and TPR domain
LSQERTILKSNALTDAEYVWLRELITSPEVYAIETYNGNIYDRPIIITNSSYEEVYKRNKKNKSDKEWCDLYFKRFNFIK